MHLKESEVFSVRTKFEVDFKWATFYVICGCLRMFKMTRYYYENSQLSELTPCDAINLFSLLNHVFYVKFIAMEMTMIPFQSLNQSISKNMDRYKSLNTKLQIKKYSL